MKPYGLIKNVKFPCKKDNHPKKGYINWWEAEMNNIVSRKTLKTITRKEIYESIQN